MGPTTLLLVRHGESAANVAAAHALAAGAEVIDVPSRDADVPLSDLGLAQAHAVGHWLAGLGADVQPQAVWSSPYVRAQQTAQAALASAGLGLEIQLDERIRDRELGVLDALTAHGVEVRTPLEAERRRWLGKFYYRPPGGESWADLALRVRSFLVDLDRDDAVRTALVVCHDAPIMVTRYVCERLTESEVLDIGERTPVGNATVTRLVRAAPTGAWRLAEHAAAEHLEQLSGPADPLDDASDAAH